MKELLTVGDVLIWPETGEEVTVTAVEYRYKGKGDHLDQVATTITVKAADGRTFDWTITPLEGCND